MENENVPVIDQTSTAEMEEPITKEMKEQRATALKRLFWFLVACSVIVLAFIIWELVDLGAR